MRGGRGLLSRRRTVPGHWVRGRGPAVVVQLAGRTPTGRQPPSRRRAPPAAPWPEPQCGKRSCMRAGSKTRRRLASLAPGRAPSVGTVPFSTSTSAIRLAFSPPAGLAHSDFNKYVVEMCPAGSPPGSCPTVDCPAAATCDQLGLPAATAYNLRAFAVRGAINGTWSNVTTTSTCAATCPAWGRCDNGAGCACALGKPLARWEPPLARASRSRRCAGGRPCSQRRGPEVTPCFGWAPLPDLCMPDGGPCPHPPAPDVTPSRRPCLDHPQATPR